MLKNCNRIVAATVFALIGQAAIAQLTTQNVVTGLSSTLQMVPDPVDSSVLYVVQQTGRVRVIQNGTVQPFDFINLSSKITTLTPLGERGVLGMEFAPDYATSGHVYFNYSSQSGIGDTQISRFTRSIGNPLQADINSEYKILSVVQPFENHKGGTIRFGPDGYLYIGMGDGGSANDPGNRAQDPNTLLGKMLRIDVSQDGFPADPNRNYAIPPDNPFVDGNPISALGEIWDFGFRNPFKWSFDKASMGGTNALIIGDVGQDGWEEIDYEPAASGGRNYGWRLREGAHNTGSGGSAAFLPLIDPIYEYPHGMGTSVTGGYVYRGSLLSGYQGRYFFADFIQKRVWSLGLSLDGLGEATVTDVTEHTAELGGSSFLGNISSIDIDRNGELYLLSYNGTLRRLLPSSIEIAPDSWNVTEGAQTLGGIPELRVSDDQYFKVRRLPMGTGTSNVKVIFEATSPIAAISQMTIKTEARVTALSNHQTIEAFNFSTGSWTLLDDVNALKTDQVRTGTISVNASQYVEAGTRRIRMRFAIGEQFERNVRWLGMIDQIQWTIRP